jgi:hypothetical protein
MPRAVCDIEEKQVASTAFDDGACTAEIIELGLFIEPPVGSIGFPQGQLCNSG